MFKCLLKDLKKSHGGDLKPRPKSQYTTYQLSYACCVVHKQVSYMWYRTVCTSKHSTVRCCWFIGSRATGGTGNSYTYKRDETFGERCSAHAQVVKDQNWLRFTHGLLVEMP